MAFRNTPDSTHERKEEGSRMNLDSTSRKSKPSIHEAFHYVVVQSRSLASIGRCARIRYANIFRLPSAEEPNETKAQYHLPRSSSPLAAFSQSSNSCCIRCSSFCRCRSWVSYASRACD